MINNIEGEVASLEPDDSCCHKWVWEELDNLIANKLSSVYLSDLLDREEEDRSSDVPNYSI